MMPKLLIIAGSDSCGGAGIQADIKAATSLKVYSAAAITCLTAQNTARVYDVFYPPADFLKKQIEVVLDDIKFDAIKIGMLGSLEVIETVANLLESKAKNIPLITDPVMIATSGDQLLKTEAFKSFIASYLVKNAFLLTPNIHEAEVLANQQIANLAEMKAAAKIIKKLGCKNVLIKGGHLATEDGMIKSILLDESGKFHLISNRSHGEQNIHGTGCTLASAIASLIAKKLPLVAAVKKANRYVYRAISKSEKIGKGSLVLGI